MGTGNAENCENAEVSGGCANAGYPAKEGVEEKNSSGPTNEDDSKQSDVLAQTPRRDPLANRIASYESDKDEGMKAWNAGNVEQAIEHWAMARGSLKYIIDNDFLKNDPDRLVKTKEDQHKMHLNLAQGFLKTGEWRQTIEYAGRALNYDSNSDKALYRMCVAYKELSEFDEARSWINKLLAAHPQNVLGKQLLKEVERSELASRRTAKISAEKIFKGIQDDHDYRVDRGRNWLSQSLSGCCRRYKRD